MFECIQRNHLAVLVTQKQVAIPIPHGDAVISACRLWEMIDWTYDEFIGECRECTRRGAEDGTENIMLYAFYNGFDIHNTARTISYIIYITLLEGILRKMYDNMFVPELCQEFRSGMSKT